MALKIDMDVWHGRVDHDEGLSAKRWHQIVHPLPNNTTHKPGILLLGFASDEGVRRNQGRIGAADGPLAIRRALANLAWHGTHPVYDAGDVQCQDGDLETAQEQLATQITHGIALGHLPVVLGGGHETAYGHWLGLVQAHPKKSIGIINFDAHFDLRQTEEPSSGTPFAQIARACAQRSIDFNYLCMGIAEPSNTHALFEHAKRLGAEWRLDRDMTPWKIKETQKQLAAFVAKVDAIYLTIDLDVLPASQMPAVSAPAAFGVDLHVIETLVRDVKSSGKMIGADVVEYNPRFDIDAHGAKIAARLVGVLAGT